METILIIVSGYITSTNTPSRPKALSDGQICKKIVSQLSSKQLKNHKCEHMVSV